MNALGKAVVSVGICIVIFLSIFLTRDFGAPFGYAGDGFSTIQEAFTDGIGASYMISKDVGKVEFDDGTIYLCTTKDNKLILCYLFRNRQKTKYYLESCSIITDPQNTEWLTSENKTETNYRVTLSSEIINNCNNIPTQHEDYTVSLGDEIKNIRLYYYRAE